MRTREWSLSEVQHTLTQLSKLLIIGRQDKAGLGIWLFGRVLALHAEVPGFDL